MFDFSPVQIIIVLVIVLLVFGAKRLPEVGRSLGHGLREFKGSVTGQAEHVSDDRVPSGDRTGEPPAALHPPGPLAARGGTPAPTPAVAEAEEAAARGGD